MMPENMYQYLVFAGIAMLAVEVVLLGFATFFLFFLGLSLVVSGVLVYFYILDSWTAIVLTNAVLTAVFAVLMWKPLKQFQQTKGIKQVKTDFDGLEFSIEQEITEKGNSSYSYSGISWQLKSADPIAANTKVKVTKVEVGIWHVAPAE